MFIHKIKSSFCVHELIHEHVIILSFACLIIKFELNKFELRLMLGLFDKTNE